MINSEEKDLREGLVYDPAVKGFDSNFWKGDTANLLNDTVRNAIKIGDTALVGSASSYSQYLYGDYEFQMILDSTTPDSNDSERYIGLRNLGDSDQRGAVYFDFSYDTVADTGTDTVFFANPVGRQSGQFRAVLFSEDGTRQRKRIRWDTLWSGAAVRTRFRFNWESDGVSFLVNDTVVATLGDRALGGATAQINTSIPQALRLSNRSLDTTDTNSTALKLLAIRNARKVI